MKISTTLRVVQLRDPHEGFGGDNPPVISVTCADSRNTSFHCNLGHDEAAHLRLGQTVTVTIEWGDDK